MGDVDGLNVNQLKNFIKARANEKMVELGYKAIYNDIDPNLLKQNQGTAIPSSDDVVSGALPIGFTFNFFGVNYTQFYAGSNGWIGFSPGQTTGYTAAFIPNAGSPLNCILGDWEDLLPGAANIFYTTIGTAPNRRLVVSYYQVPHYGCRTNLHTFQGEDERSFCGPKFI